MTDDPMQTAQDLVDYVKSLDPGECLGEALHVATALVRLEDVDYTPRVREVVRAIMLPTLLGMLRELEQRSDIAVVHPVHGDKGVLHSCVLFKRALEVATR